MCDMPISDKRGYTLVFIFQKFLKEKKFCPSGYEKYTQSGGPPETICFFKVWPHSPGFLVSVRGAIYF